MSMVDYLNLRKDKNPNVFEGLPRECHMTPDSFSRYCEVNFGLSSSCIQYLEEKYAQGMNLQPYLMELGQFKAGPNLEALQPWSQAYKQEIEAQDCLLTNCPQFD